MTWTKEDTELLRQTPICDNDVGGRRDREGYIYYANRERVSRAAARIEALEARVARLETEYECHPQGGVPGCDCWECLRTRIAELEAEREEVARELREVQRTIDLAGHVRWVDALDDIADRLERKVE